MNRIEDELKAALRRKPAPPGFASSVMERIEDVTPAGNVSPLFVPRRRWILAAAAMTILIVWGGLFAHRQYIRTRNETSLQRTLTAISIAAIELDRAESRAFDSIQLERLGKQLAEFEIEDKK
jgi:hypothetical protein